MSTDTVPTGSATTARPGVVERANAAIYEPFLWLGEVRGMRRRRAELLGRARGRVLEIGAGTGLNLPHYRSELDELVLTEPDPGMSARLRTRTRRSGREVTVVEAEAELLPLPDASVDTVVSTMVLCTVPDPGAALREISRVLRPGGRFLFCEHVLSSSDRAARWQRRLAGPWAAVAMGCRCDRPLLAEIGRVLALEDVARSTWRGMPALVHPLVIGSARRPG